MFSFFANLRLHSAFCVGPALRLLVVEKEVVLDNHPIDHRENHFNAWGLIQEKSWDIMRTGDRSVAKFPDGGYSVLISSSLVFENDREGAHLLCYGSTRMKNIDPAAGGGRLKQLRAPLR